MRNELERNGQLETVGGLEYLQRMMETVPSAASVLYYADIVREKMLLRETISAASDILNDAYDESGSAVEKLDEAERRIFAVTDKRITSAASALKDLVTRGLRADREARREPRYRFADGLLRTGRHDLRASEG